MPFIPHTPDDIQSMLQTLSISSIDALFKEIPEHLKIDHIPHITEGMTELEVTQHFAQQLELDKSLPCFIGAGAYRHYIPAAVWEIASRGEYLTAYTPYQAEASQGTLQLLWEYQSMMAALMDLDVSNASLYDGATAVAEAVLMACRLHRKQSHALIGVPLSLHPYYRQVLKSIVTREHIELVEFHFDANGLTQLPNEMENLTAFIIPQPNFFGVLEDVDRLTDWAHAQGAYAIAAVNPLSMSLLKPPGQWGQRGVDIACGEGQPLGVPLSSGGPYFGFICCQMPWVRQMPGRIVGRTEDTDGKVGYTLTLQAREQHIRRAKATSNICTNQGLLVTAATIYMSLLGGLGLQNTAAVCAHRLAAFAEKLEAIPGVKRLFPSNHFHEMLITLPKPVSEVIDRMLERGFLAGYSVQDDYPNLKNALLVCTTELNTEEQCTQYCQALSQILL
jgi:glycine dehydrogenase subunit 1